MILDRLRQLIVDSRHELATGSDSRRFDQILSLLDEVGAEIDSFVSTQAQMEARLRHELEQSRASFLKTEQSFRTIFENSPVGIAQLDSNLRFIAVNPAFQKMLGYSEPELVQMSALDVTHPEEREISREMIPQILLDGGLMSYEKRYLHKSGRVVWGTGFQPDRSARAG